jgi:A/G-specific adenine glycosylase
MTVAGARQRKKRRSLCAPKAAALLAWYDRNRRILSWRAGPRESPNPYRVWLSEIMLQQTTVRAVAPYFERFVARWPDVAALAAAPLEDVLKAWAGLGYYARARNLHACAGKVANDHGGRFPDTEQGLRALPGVGAYTAAAIAAIAFGRHAAPVDGNVERVIARLYGVTEPLPAAKRAIGARALELAPARRAGDFAQAMMDLGATICTPRRPACGLCPWREDCVAHRADVAEMLPRKAPKPQGRLRRGAAFWVLRADGCVLVRTRPARGLLGGMTEVPSSDWSADFDFADALAAAPRLSDRAGERMQPDWRPLPDIVAHVFTHFPLELTVYAATAPVDAAPPPGMRWTPLSRLDEEALPNLMRKVAAHALRVYDTAA